MSGDSGGSGTENMADSKEPNAPSQGRGLGKGIKILLIVGGILVLLVVLGAIAVVPSFMQMQSKSKLSELPVSMAGIRAAQIMYFETVGLYVPSDPCPSGPPQQGLRDWPDDCSGFEAISWSADSQVRGVYWTEVAPDGSDFTVYGISDIDGDGVFATYTATKDARPAAVTEEGVY
jgi:type II secretory pathway pseudopilin PulG